MKPNTTNDLEDFVMWAANMATEYVKGGTYHTKQFRNKLEQLISSEVEKRHMKWDLRKLRGTYDAQVLNALFNGGWTVILPDCDIDVNKEKKTLTIKLLNSKRGKP